MAYITGTADDYIDLVSRLRQYCLGYVVSSQSSLTGTGDGTLTKIESFAGSVAQTWTVTCTQIGADTTTDMGVVNGDAESAIGAEWQQYNGKPLFDRSNVTYADGAWGFQASTSTAEPGMYQRYDLAAKGVSTTDIDAGACNFFATAKVRNASTPDGDYGVVTIIFRDVSLVEISNVASEQMVDYTAFTTKTFSAPIPANTRYVDVVFEAFYNAGVATSFYFDTYTAEAVTYNRRFSVSGSVSGAQPTAVVGRRYIESTAVNFTLDDGLTAFAVSDQFTFTTSANNVPAIEQWSEHRYESNFDPGIDATFEWMAEAPGASGTDAIFVGLRAIYNATYSYPIIRLFGATGYDAGATLYNQPGSIPFNLAQYDSTPVMPVWENNEVVYWFIVSGRRAIIVAKMGSVYEMAYLGFILPYSLPSEYPYPLFVGGSGVANLEGAQVSDTHYHHRAFWNCSIDLTSSTGSPPARLRTPAGQWAKFANLLESSSYADGAYIDDGSWYVTWPYFGNGMALLRENLDGTLPMFPIMFIRTGQWVDREGGYFGQLDGINAVCGFGVASEDTITYGGDTYLIVQNVFRTSEQDFCAVRLA